MFESTTSKLEECLTLLDQLKISQDIQQFRSLFTALINALRAITNYLQVDGKNIPQFMEWYVIKQEEMRNDELLQFIHDARIDDFHKGKNRLVVLGTTILHFSTDNAGPPPIPNADLVIGAEGPFWIVNRNTAKEKRIPIKTGGSWVVQMGIENAPAVHKGTQLEKKDPITLSELAIDYFQNLLYEAKTKFC
jgi:hypothetical protein